MGVVRRLPLGASSKGGQRMTERSFRRSLLLGVVVVLALLLASTVGGAAQAGPPTGATPGKSIDHRVADGVESASAARTVANELAATGIPAGAVRIDVVGQVHALATLRDRVRPL